MTLRVWEKNGLMQFQVDETSKAFAQYLSFGFGFYDHNRVSEYPRQRIENGSVVFQSTLWDFASSFAHSATSHELASALEKECGEVEPGSQEERLIANIRVMDDFFHYGFTVKTNLDSRWEMTHLYMPNYSSEDIAKMIPKKYQSKTKRYWESTQRNQPHFSPPLIHSRKEGWMKKFQYNFEQEVGTIPLELQERFYKRWAHPIIIFDKSEATDNYFLQMNMSADGLLEWMSFKYPRLRLQHESLYREIQSGYALRL